ncbi:hypothetical protein GBAR_LOCUS22227 [Geodia barretti]|uniref:Protein-S-isoprenylcysteine O-methyltransferase n=1 Tax=Geodia barretti TaxID=519541 RepID=A0AA35X4Z0_GEOBA|nr:hypothetical protein GBAR_LOCUS22227 [Geodia barretti]
MSIREFRGSLTISECNSLSIFRDRACVQTVLGSQIWGCNNMQWTLHKWWHLPLFMMGYHDSCSGEGGTGDGQLTVSGVYGWARHPMYTGVLIFLWSQPTMLMHFEILGGWKRYPGSNTASHSYDSVGSFVLCSGGHTITYIPYM